MNKWEPNPYGTPRAFCAQDIEFYDNAKRYLPWNIALKRPMDVALVKVTWRWQKNQQNGEYRWFARNKQRTYLCGVAAWIRIAQRFQCLIGNSTKLIPMAVYRHADGGVRYLTADRVSYRVKQLAKDVHQITAENDLKKFSCHLLRVGACCIYFAAGYPAEFIQRVLRWESDAWKKYVRDLVCTAIKANKAINSVEELPLM